MTSISATLTSATNKPSSFTNNITFSSSFFQQVHRHPITHQVALIEQFVSPGGGAWLGGQLFSALIIRKPAHRPSVKLFYVVSAEDLIVKKGRVAGVVTNWALVSMNHNTQTHMDPNVMEAKFVLSSCGHGGPCGATVVKRLKDIGMIDSVDSRLKDTGV